MRPTALLLATLCLGSALAFGAEPKDSGPNWREYVGQPAPPLTGAGWEGAPVSLEAAKGNVVLLGFWNCRGGG